MSARAWLFLLLAPAANCQLSEQQKVFDFQQLASVFAKNYAPYEWKRDALKFDLYDVAPWLERVRAAKDDLEFWEVCATYAASLRDSHTGVSFPSNFAATISASADIYGGRVLIESVTRSSLPADRFPFARGDEIVSVDGKPVGEWLDQMVQLIGEGGERAARRWAAGYLFNRPQSVFPTAARLGDTLKLGVRLASGEVREFEIPWSKRGYPLPGAGRTPNPVAGLWSRTPKLAGADRPFYKEFLEALDRKSIGETPRVTGYGARAPYYSLPSNFVQRLGRRTSDFHYSGIYEAGGKRIAFLRIPSFQPSSSAAAVLELETEIAYFKDNADGLVVDITRNPGGSCYGLEALRRLIAQPFQLPADEIRATLSTSYAAELALIDARNRRAEPVVIERLEKIFQEVRNALAEDRGRTSPLPFCGSTVDQMPAMDSTGKVLAYPGPLVLLVDELTASWGDIFAAVIQDSRRGPVFGMFTNGAGGSYDTAPAGFFSEMTASFTNTISVRQRAVHTAWAGVTRYLENTGVEPDIFYDFMTQENFDNSGRPFVEAFTAAILAEIAKGQQ